jgi:serine/threonine protein kinase
VELVYEEDDVRIGGGAVDDGLEALLVLAAVHRPRDQVEVAHRVDADVLEGGGHAPPDDALREPLDDGGLADARLADEHRVVLRLPEQDRDEAVGLAVAAGPRGGAEGACGTPLYMAPEQWSGYADVRSDIYSFALIWLEMLTGRTGIEGSSLEEVRAVIEVAGAQRQPIEASTA